MVGNDDIGSLIIFGVNRLCNMHAKLSEIQAFPNKSKNKIDQSRRFTGFTSSKSLRKGLFFLFHIVPHSVLPCNGIIC